jgi:hypothetical protein
VEDFLTEIKGAVDARLFYLALFGTVMLPDLCGALESSDGQASGAKFIAWFDRYMTPQYTLWGRRMFDGEECYGFRCSMLHQGKVTHPKSKYRRICFVEPDNPRRNLHVCGNQDGTEFYLDIPTFCAEMSQGVKRWLADVAGTEPYETNVASLIRSRPTNLIGAIVPVYG